MNRIIFRIGHTVLTTLVLGAALTLVVGTTGCGKTISLVPEGADASPNAVSTIVSGTGAKLLAIDGEPVDASRVLVVPGDHVIDFKVRRSMRKVMTGMDGVYAVGTCQVKVSTVAGDVHQVAGRLSTEVEKRGDKRSDYLGSTMTSFNTVPLVENVTTGDARFVKCALRLDCRSLDTSRMRPSSSCTYYE